MSKRQVIILWIIAAVLATLVAVVKVSQKDPAESTTERKPGDTLLESFPAADISRIEIKDATHTTTLVKSDSGWSVAERDNYPASTANVLEFLRNIEDVEITRGIEAGPSFAPRFGMDENASTNNEHGLTATFSSSKGDELAKATLGKNIEQSAGGSAAALVGRYIRNHTDSSGFYATSEMFPSVSAEPARWLDDQFLNIEKIQSITLSKNNSDEVEWSLTRGSEEAAFQIVGGTPGEVANTTNTDPLKSLLSYARFDDVVPADQVARRATDAGSQRATIITFEGFTYVLTLTPSRSSNHHLLAIEVSATLPEKRKPEENESADAAQTRDHAFTSRLQALQEKLASEKALEGRTFQMAKTSLSTLLKSRSEMVTKAAPPKQQATTPPIPLKPAQP